MSESQESSSTRLPHTYEEMTPEWMSSALSEAFPGVRVRRVSRSDERIGTSASCRLKIDYDDRGRAGEAPDFLYVKGGFDDNQRKRYWGALQQEVRFYREFAATTPMHIPRCYFAANDDHQQGITMLEDIGTRGVTFGNWGALSVDQVAAELEQLARLHARWWRDPVLKTLAGYELPARNFYKYMVRDKHWEELRGRVYGRELVEVIPHPELIRQALDKMWALNDEAPATLVHGDTHGGNMFFESDGRAGILDFQLYFATTPMYDVSWLIVSGLGIEDRRKDERHLLKHYLSLAKARGIELPDFEQTWLVHRQQMAHAFVSGACEPILAGPIEQINAAAKVTIAAAGDLDVLDALGIARH